jgi:uncharacterized protein (TIGR03435 family)
MKMLLLFPLALALGAQTAAFDAASIKLNRSGSGSSSIRSSTGRVTMENVSVKKVTLWSQGIPDDREYALTGPDWLATERFDIQATFPAEAQQMQVRLMMQSLLAERFKLALHHESRQLPIYVLVVAKNGPKLRAAPGDQSRTSGRSGRLQATATTIQKLADLLARMTGQPVINETNLNGAFDFNLEWSPDETEKLNGPVEGAPAAASGPSLFAALQEQLGLKLEGRKGPVDVLVVDHIERMPTEN